MVGSKQACCGTNAFALSPIHCNRTCQKNSAFVIPSNIKDIYQARDSLSSRSDFSTPPTESNPAEDRSDHDHIFFEAFANSDIAHIPTSMTPSKCDRGMSFHTDYVISPYFALKLNQIASEYRKHPWQDFCSFFPYIHFATGGAKCHSRRCVNRTFPYKFGIKKLVRLFQTNFNEIFMQSRVWI